MYPRLLVHLGRIEENARRIVELARRFNVDLVGITKVVLGDPRIAKAMVKAGIRTLGDSRLLNIRRMRDNGVNARFQLIRLPMISELELVVELVDCVLVSELRTIEALNEVLKSKGRKMDIIYMVDIGELREGAWYKEAVEEIVKVIKYENVRLIGIGTNLGCLNGVLATPQNLSILLEIRDKLAGLGVDIPLISAGNTSTLFLMENNTLPEGINQFRVGEAIVLGTDVTRDRKIEMLRQDTMELQAEILELKSKPSRPLGELNKDAFGRKTVVKDRGIRKRAILALGEQDIMYTGLYPLMSGIEVIRASSDHLVVDVTDSEKNWKVGDIISFRVSYGALLRSMTSPYVEKVYIDD
ncbi:MAG: alanine/ornithine racemase family PLP-dependent enzyme [Thermotogae bacterium]|nr:alanine/ornithine racemase family PLP-dependent enzyme [Thermotogota bacterium]